MFEIGDIVWIDSRFNSDLILDIGYIITANYEYFTVQWIETTHKYQQGINHDWKIQKLTHL